MQEKSLLAEESLWRRCQISSLNEKHALTPWRSEKLVVLMVAGDKVFAKHFLKRVFNPSYRFPNEDIVLVHHETDHGQVSVNILEALDYLIGEHQVDRVTSTMTLSFKINCACGEILQMGRWMLTFLTRQHGQTEKTTLLCTTM